MDFLNKLPEAMRPAFEEMDDPIRAAELAALYLEADEDTKADILAFFESGGPEIVRQMVLQREDGTPTAGDLERWL